MKLRMGSRKACVDATDDESWLPEAGPGKTELLGDAASLWLCWSC